MKIVFTFVGAKTRNKTSAFMKNGINGKKIVWSAVIVVILLTGGGFVTYSLGGSYSKVLCHYIFVDFSIEKLRSAMFLISNLKYHNTQLTADSLTSEQQAFKARTDSVCQALCNKYGWKNVPIDSIFAERKSSALWIDRHLSNNNSKQSTLQPCGDALTPELMISQIDFAHNVWKTSPFAKDLTFDEYKEAILPFVCINNYGELHDLNYYHGAISLLSKIGTLQTLSERVAYYAKIIQYLRDINASIGKKSFGGLMSMYSRDEDCLSIVHYACMIMRSFGMPVAVDHVAGYRELTGRHYFCSLYNTKLKTWQGFNPEGSLPGDSAFLGAPTLNIYRDMFEAQKDAPYFVRGKGEFVPIHLASPCLRDVTEQYSPVTQITLPFNLSTNNKLAYLAAFDCRGNNGLVASTWGMIDQRHHSVTFKKVLPNTLFFPICYNGEESVCFGKPFYVKMIGGNPHICHLPSKDGATPTTDVLLLRKYPVKPNMQLLADHLKGSVILGSNDKTFAKADTLLRFLFAPTQYIKIYTFNKTGKYRYYRFVPPQQYPNANIAHMEWLTSHPDNGENAMQASREAITRPLLVKKATKMQSHYVQLTDAVLKNMQASPQYDHNPLTSAGGYPFFTLQLSKPKLVEAVNLMAMHAGNTITSGHQYLLLYWDNGWKVCAHATAKYEYLEFHNIPSNKLYWLYDITEGQEEMPFLITNGTQHFLYGEIIK